MTLDDNQQMLLTAGYMEQPSIHALISGQRLRLVRSLLAAGVIQYRFAPLMFHSCHDVIVAGLFISTTFLSAAPTMPKAHLPTAEPFRSRRVIML